jgi:hypothetical protein
MLRWFGSKKKHLYVATEGLGSSNASNTACNKKTKTKPKKKNAWDEDCGI